MSHHNFFKPYSAAAVFQAKLEDAIQLISNNQSLIAIKVTKALDANVVHIGSFFDLTPNHYASLQKSFRKDDEINLPDVFPPNESAVFQIESLLEGIIYEDKYIYLNSSKNSQEIASTIIHEVGHYLNSKIYNQEYESKPCTIVGYRDEIRSFTAERMFEKNGFCITRGDMKAIHQTVSRLYPDFTTQKPSPDTSGYIYGSYDTPIP